MNVLKPSTSLLGPTAACAELGIADLTSYGSMKENGWDLDNIEEERRLVLRGKECNRKLFDDWLVQGWETSMISTSFWSKGRATLKFGNCNNLGNVKVLIDGSEVGTSKANGKKSTASFNFDEGSNLTIKAEGQSVIKLFSLKIQCGKRKRESENIISKQFSKKYAI